MTNQNILLARQPIYDAKLNVVAYELMYSPPEDATPASSDKEAETTQLLVSAFADIGIGQVADNRPAFIEFSRSWLLNPLPLSPGQTTIQIGKTIRPEGDVIAAIAALRDAGFNIAMDCVSTLLESEELVKLVNILIVDVSHLRGETLQKLVDFMKQRGVTLMAEKVENYAVFEHCMNLGFQLFQGGFLCRPQAVKGNGLAANKVVVMNLLAALQNPRVDLSSLERIIANDVTLSLKLLRICNSASYASQGKIDSIKRAIMVLGLQNLKTWTSVIALSRMSDKPTELVRISLTRAKMMEGLGKRGNLSPEKCFTVGLFSSIDAFFDHDMKAIMDSLPFDDDIKSALLTQDGPLGQTLKLTTTFERGEWLKLDWNFLQALQVDKKILEAAYVEAVKWASEVMQSLHN